MKIAVYCGSSPRANEEYMVAAQELGTWMGRHEHTLVYGGSSIGLMGAVSRAVLEAGGKAIGVEPAFFIEAGVEQHDLTQLIVVETMAERKAKMIELADVFVALPGGVGTLEEISEIMSRLRLRMNSGPCYFLNLNGFYDGLKDLLDKMLEGEFIEDVTLEDYVFVERVDELERLLDHHRVTVNDGVPVPVVPESNLRIG